MYISHKSGIIEREVQLMIDRSDRRLLMKTNYDLKLNQMTEEYLELSKAYKWELDFYKQVIVLWHIVNHHKLDIDHIKGMMDYIGETGDNRITSNQDMKFPLAGLLCAKEDLPENSYDRMLNMENILQLNGYSRPLFKPLSSYVLLQLSSADTMEEVLFEARGKFVRLNKLHPFLIKGEDFPIALMMSAGKISVETIDRYYQALIRKGFVQSVGLMWLAFIVSLSGKDHDYMAKRCKLIKKALSDNALKLSRKYDSAIGLIALFHSDIDLAMDEIVSIEKSMKHRKGFKWLGKDMWVFISAAMISDNEIPESVEEKDRMNLALVAMLTSVLSAMTLDLSKL